MCQLGSIQYYFLSTLCPNHCYNFPPGLIPSTSPAPSSPPNLPSSPYLTKSQSDMQRAASEPQKPHIHTGNLKKHVYRPQNINWLTVYCVFLHILILVLTTNL